MEVVVQARIVKLRSSVFSTVKPSCRIRLISCMPRHRFCQVRQQTTHVLAPVLIWVATLLGSSMPAKPSRYFWDISACGSLAMINTSKSNPISIDGLLSNSCQAPVEFPLKFDRRPVDFQSVPVGFLMDS